MAELTARRRNALPKSDFGLPGERKYPMPDASHARDAKARASAAVKRGDLTEKERDRIHAKADRVLNET